MAGKKTTKKSAKTTKVCSEKGSAMGNSGLPVRKAEHQKGQSALSVEEQLQGNTDVLEVLQDRTDSIEDTLGTIVDMLRQHPRRDSSREREGRRNDICEGGRGTSKSSQQASASRDDVTLPGGRAPRSRSQGDRRGRSEARRGREGTRSSRSSSDSSYYQAKKAQRGEFDHKNYLTKGQKIDSIETLLLVNLRVLKQLNEEGEDITGLVDHMELLIEKSCTKIYLLSSLSAYDAAVKTRASEDGIGAFKSVSNSEVLRHLSYDGTVVAQRAYSQSKARPTGTKTGTVGTSQNSCFAFNKVDGCKFNPCRFRHSCSSCGTPGHSAVNCKKAENKA